MMSSIRTLLAAATMLVLAVSPFPVANAAPALMSYVRITDYHALMYVPPSAVSGYVFFVGESPLKFEAAIFNRAGTEAELITRDWSPQTAFRIALGIDRRVDLIDRTPVQIEPTVDATALIKTRDGDFGPIAWADTLHLPAGATFGVHGEVAVSRLEPGSYQLVVDPQLKTVQGEQVFANSRTVRFEVRAIKDRLDRVEVLLRRAAKAITIEGDVAGGERTLDEVLRLFPECAAAYKYKAFVASLNGHKPDQARFLETALEMVDSQRDPYYLRNATETERRGATDELRRAVEVARKQ